MNGVGGPVASRNPDQADRGPQWIRIQAMPYRQINEIEFENPAMIHVYDLDEESGLETADLIGAHILAAKQIHVGNRWVSQSGIDIGYTKLTDPELIEYTRYQMAGFFVTKGQPLE
jgi:hypothetical protein